MMKQRPYLIAEIGGNHQGDRKRLERLTSLAIDSGADCIKFQLYSGDTLVNKNIDQTRNLHFRKFELNLEVYDKMFEKVMDAGLDCTASFWSFEFYERYKGFIPFIKIGSGDLTNYPLIKQFTKTSKPIILSTGLSSYDEVSQAVKYIRNQNSFYNTQSNLTVLQCTSMYPIPPNEANLSVMNEFKKLNVKVGYSDHTIGEEALYIAGIMGASVLEFHFTDDKQDASFRDHLVSLEKDDVQNLVLRFDNALEMIGSNLKIPTPSETEAGHVQSFRRGIYCSKPISKGEIISMDKLTFLRPDLGSNSTIHYDRLINTEAKRDYDYLDPIAVDER